MLQSVKGITILIDGDYIVTAYSLYSIHIHPFYPHQQWQTCPPSTVPNSSSHQVTTVVAAHQMVRANGPESNCVHAEVSSHVSDSQKFRSSHGPGLTSSSRLTSRCGRCRYTQDQELAMTGGAVVVVQLSRLVVALSYVKSAYSLSAHFRKRAWNDGRAYNCLLIIT